MPTTHNYRRGQFLAEPPSSGSFVQSPSGRFILRIERATVHRRSGEPAARDTIRLKFKRVTPEQMPQGAALLAWPVSQTPIAEPSAEPLVKPPGKSRRAQRPRRTKPKGRPEEIDSVVPAAQRNAVFGVGGVFVRGPLSVPGTWRDPADDQNVRSRTARMVQGGYRPYDPLRALAKRRDTDITAEHVAAAECYRLRWERGPGRSVGGGRSLFFHDRQFGPSTGPTELLVRGMAAWEALQRQLNGAARECLQCIVLERMPPTQWAQRSWKRDPRYAMGYFRGVMDQLLLLLNDDVKSALATDLVALD